MYSNLTLVNEDVQSRPQTADGTAPEQLETEEDASREKKFTQVKQDLQKQVQRLQKELEKQRHAYLEEVAKKEKDRIRLEKDVGALSDKLRQLETVRTLLCSHDSLISSRKRTE